MIYVFFSICCSVFVSILFKLAGRYGIKTGQAIAWNYLSAAALTLLFYPSDPLRAIDEVPWMDYLSLAVLLPGIFVFISLSIRSTGIIRTAIGQRLSLAIPVLAAFLLFNEQLNPLKLGGLLLGFIAIACSIPWKKEEQHGGWFYPLVVFLGTGIIDIFFNRIAQFKAIPFTQGLFLIFSMAFIISLLTIIVRHILDVESLRLKNLLAGLILGLFNFGSILFYLMALKASPDRPSVIFSALDVGVIALGSVAGFFLFKERLSLLNKIGIALACAAILIITFA